MWDSCVDDVPPGVECAFVAVPIEHGDPEGPAREIAVRRVPALEPARGQLWYVDGGPGDSGTADLADVAGAHELFPDLDLVAFDVRGVGDSGRLGCPAQEASSSEEGTEIVGDEWGACLDQVADVPDLDTYTTAQTAHDLADLIAELGEGTVVLWGVSYGTFLVNRLLVDHPDVADAIVLDGLAPPTWTFSEFDAGLDAQARRWLSEACADDAACRAHLGSDPEGYAEQVLTLVENGHCKKLGLDAPTTRLLAGVLFQVGGDLATQMPPVFHRLERCKQRDVKAFVHLFDTLFPEGGGGVGEKSSHSAVLQRQIAYTDLWAPGADPDALHDALEHVVATTAVSASFSDWAAEWPAGPPDPEVGRFADPPAVPVLLLHGGYDASLSLDVARSYAAAWPDALWVAVPFAPHVAFNAGDCPQSIVERFVAVPDAPVDTSCVADMPPPSFAADPDVDVDVWGTDDRWGDDCGGCRHLPAAVGAQAMLVALAAGRRRRTRPRV
jgi:pimeloyl-ACP methyl ester carboxylesterase